jgi:hypothetical protein
MQKSSLLRVDQNRGFTCPVRCKILSCWTVTEPWPGLVWPGLAWNPYIHNQKGSHTGPIISTLAHVEC